MLVALIAKAKFPSVRIEVVVVVGSILSGLCLAIPLSASQKLRKEHPIEKKRTSALDFSQFALAPTDARLQLKNDQDRARFWVSAIPFVAYIVMLARELCSASPNVRAIKNPRRERRGI